MCLVFVCLGDIICCIVYSIVCKLHHVYIYKSVFVLSLGTSDFLNPTPINRTEHHLHRLTIHSLSI